MIDETAAKLPPVIDLGSTQLIKDIEELTSSLQEGLDVEGAVVINATAIEAIDTASLQLLVAFANTLRKQSRVLEWLKPSDAFVEIAELVDLVQPLDLHVLTTIAPQTVEPIVKTGEKEAPPKPSITPKTVEPEPIVPVVADPIVPAPQVADPIAPEPIAAQVAEPIAPVVADPIVPPVPQVADSVASKVAEPVAEKIAEPVALEVTEPVAATPDESAVSVTTEPEVVEEAEPVSEEPLVEDLAAIAEEEDESEEGSEVEEDSEPEESTKEKIELIPVF